MGCAASRAACEGEETIPAKVRPVLRRRFNELRQKKKSSKNNNNDDLIDEKKLLRGDQECREVELSSISSSSLDDSFQKLTTEKAAKPALTRAVSMLPIVKENTNGVKLIKGQEEEGKHDNEHDLREKNSMKIRENNVEKKEEEEEEEEDEEGDEVDEGRMLCKNNNNEWGYDCPGSPSFRVYCVESIDSDDDDDKGHQDEEIDLTNEEVDELCGQNHNSSHNQDISHDDKPIKSVKDGESNNVRKKGKRERARGFGMRVMPKSGRAAVKNLLHGKSSCYNASSCTSLHHHHHLHDKTHLLPKPAA